MQHLHRIRAYKQPKSVNIWLDVFFQWNFSDSFFKCDDLNFDLLQDMVNLKDENLNEHIILDHNLIPLILYIGTVLLRFPRLGWFEDWVLLCKKVGFDVFKQNLCNVLRLSMSFEFILNFWCDFFLLVLFCSRFYLINNHVTMDKIENALDMFVNHLYDEDFGFCFEKKCTVNVFLRLLFLVSSSDENVDDLFFYVAKTHFLKWFDNKMNHFSLISKVNIGFIQQPLFYLIIDFAPNLGFFLLQNLNSYSEIGLYDETYVSNLATTCLIEYEYNKNYNSIQLEKVLAFPKDVCDEWNVNWNSQVKSLLLITKVRIRLLLRASYHHSLVPKKSIEHLINELPVSILLRRYLNILPY